LITKNASYLPTFMAMIDVPTALTRIVGSASWTLAALGDEHLIAFRPRDAISSAKVEIQATGNALMLVLLIVGAARR